MDEEEVKVNGANIKIESIKVTQNPKELEESEIDEDEFLEQFSDEPLTEDPNRFRLKSIIDYLKSKSFVKDINRQAYKTGIPPKQIAKGAISKAFGIVGDILGVTVGTVNHTLNGLVDLLSSLLHSAINLVTRLVNGLCRIITFNQTATC